MDERVVSREVRRAQLPEPKVQKGLVGVHRASGTAARATRSAMTSSGKAPDT